MATQQFNTDVDVNGEVKGTSLDINGNADISGTLTVGVNDTGHDVKFFGATSGSSFLYDQSADQLTITHPTGVTGIEAYTNSGAVPTVPQIKIGRDSNQYWGVYTVDRTAHLVHRQDETDSGAMNTSFELWGGGSGNDNWVWRHGTNSGGSLATVMTLDKAGQLTVTGEIEGGSLDINGNADILGNLDVGGDLDVSGTITGDGSAVSSINASNISSGTLAAARVATLNQNTTGSAATLTTARTIAGVSFNGSANIALNNNAITNGAGYTGDQSQSDINALGITTVGTISSGEWRGTRISTAYQYQRQTFEFKGYATHDGTNYEMAEIMTDTNAPFEHNTSTGANGTDATAVSLLLRSAGQVMPYAGTIKKWKGWAAGSGSGTTYIALFRYRPVVGSSSAVSPVLIDEQTLTVAGNNKTVAIEQTSFTDGDIAAGDIIISMLKGVNGKTTYFTSTMEIEWD